MIEVDDPYVVERTVAAAFGAACAHQMPDPAGPFEHALRDWLARLRGCFLDGGSSPTSHELLREYIRITYQFVGTLHSAAVPHGVDPFALRFAPVAPAEAMPDDDPRTEECDKTFGMDFENYVIGPAINGRESYDFEHPEFRKARAEVMARIWDLGWRENEFGAIDQQIAMASDRPYSNSRKVERYGKKYGWIAYHELFGRLVDAGRAPAPFGDVERLTPDIDPAFPDRPPVAPMLLPSWAPADPTDDKTWLASGEVVVPDELWSPDEIHGVEGGWLLVEGYLNHDLDGRSVFGFFRTILLNPNDVEPAEQLASECPYLGNDFFPQLPQVHDLLAAELPWSPRFELTGEDDSDVHVRPPALRRDWLDPGIEVGQIAVRVTSGVDSEDGLGGAYDVPSPEFAARFGLRQLPGTADFVGLDGSRASAVFRTDRPWRGHLLFIRRDLVEEFAGDRRIMQVAWGEREVTVDWSAPPRWVRSAQRSHENMWRHIRVLEVSRVK
ncbi:Uncharacterised protein [Nocardia farcinica]|uniref:hypothetical protein n=1 Tax=Nocardia farcinica TaxID=37329 RepID=UPI000DFD8FFC|nr:hypothetical protein [Nocardia farcinica]SUE28938.1 Uncharacterised protein [Nocardia farcinica]